MKVVIKAGSQEEFDEKREELIKAVAGSKFDVTIRPKGESLASEPKEPFYASGAEILTEWDDAFADTLRAIKHDISEVIEHG
jgi:hypothetical protein